MEEIRAKFNLGHYLVQGQQIIDEALNRFIPSEKGKFGSIHKALRYSVFAGGKRLRPILCLSSYGIFQDKLLGKSKLEIILSAACALECIHTYSLIHDDLPCMDNDDFRRGKPTSHKVFGEGMAVLAGDSLLTLAFELVSKTPQTSPETVLRALKELAFASGTFGLIGGQIEDLESEGKTVTPSQLQSIHEHKTAALIKVAVCLGGIFGEASQDELDRLSTFGQKIGLAFQVVDDILDVESNSTQLGKTAQKRFKPTKSNLSFSFWPGEI